MTLFQAGDPILSFDGQFNFLSNMHLVGVHDTDNDILWKSSEHYYQAQRVTNRYSFAKVYSASNAFVSKKIARKLQDISKEQWDKEKVNAMRNALWFKFSSDLHGMKSLLLSTGDRELVEGNTWGDTFWGVCDGEGLNVLGNLLMELRDCLRHGLPFKREPILK